MVDTKERETYQATGTPRRLVHHNFMVSNAARSIDFYNQVVGFEETFRVPDINAGFLSNGNTHHDLAFSEVSDRTRERTEKIRALGHTEVPADWGAKPGLHHFAYEMFNEAELVAAYDRLVEFEVKPWLMDDRVVTRSVYFSDPEGNGIEYTVDMLSNWRDYRRPGIKLEHTDYVPGQEKPRTETFINLNPEVRRVEGAALHPKRSAHSMIVAHDFTKMRRFYIDAVGLREMFLAPNGDFSVLHGKDFPGYSFVLAAESPNRPAGVHHISFEMVSADEIRGAEKSLAAHGVEIEYKIEHPKKQVVCFRDPDGVLVQCFHEEPDFLDALEGMEPALALLLV